MAQPNALDFVDPYLSARRQFVCEHLTILLPNTEAIIASNNPATSARFKDRTGQTQQKLETAWGLEGFTKGQNGSWTRRGAAPSPPPARG